MGDATCLYEKMYDDPAYVLAVLALQSNRYVEDPEYSKAVRDTMADLNAKHAPPSETREPTIQQDGARTPTDREYGDGNPMYIIGEGGFETSEPVGEDDLVQRTEVQEIVHAELERALSHPSSTGMVNDITRAMDAVGEAVARLRSTAPPETFVHCAGCRRPYSDPGFPDLVVRDDVWRAIRSPCSRRQTNHERRKL